MSDDDNDDYDDDNNIAIIVSDFFPYCWNLITIVFW